MKVSKILKLFIIISTLVMCDVHLIAQNYQVIFKAEGATSTLDYVKVMNLSNCEMVQLNGLDTLLLEQPYYIGSFDMSINNVQVYPNPMSGKCNLKYFSKSGDDLAISIYDLGMKLLKSKDVKVEQGAHIFEISGLKSGVYILTVQNGKEIFTQRLVSMSALEVAIDIKYSNIVRDILLHTSVINNLIAILVIDIPPTFHSLFFCPITTPLYPTLPASKSPSPIHTLYNGFEGYF